MQLSRLFELLGALVLIATLALVGRVGVVEWRSVNHALNSLRALEELRRGLVAVEMASRERGPTNAVLGGAAPTPDEKRKSLIEARERTDQAFSQLEQFLQQEHAGGAGVQQVQKARFSLSQARSMVDETAAVEKESRAPESIRHAVYGMVAVVPMLAPVTNASANAAVESLPAIGDEVFGARLAAELREYAGLLGSHFTAALATARPFTSKERRAIDETRGRVAQLRALLELRLSSPHISPEVESRWVDATQRYFGQAYELADQIMVQGETGVAYDLTAAEFAARYVPDMNSILSLRDALLDQAREKASREHKRARTVLLAVMAGAAGLLLLLGTALYLMERRVLRPLEQTTRALKALAANDLHAPLPVPVAQDEMAAVIGAVRSLQGNIQQRLALEGERDQLIEQLQRQSDTDFLTGLPNRRAFIASAERLLAAASRQGFDMSVVMMDIDNFKQLNDSLGHAAGDVALQAVADAVRSQLRGGDLVARFGGEEFVVMLAYCDSYQAKAFAERLREAVARAPIALPSGEAVAVTASLGVVDSLRAGLVLDSLVSAADAAMYQAKQAGRNRVAVAHPPAEASDTAW